MDYVVPREILEKKFGEWKRAMLLNIYHSLGQEYEAGNPESFEIDSVLKYNLLISGLTGLLHTRFRGEARYHPNPCIPIIARNPIIGDPITYELSEIQRFKESASGLLFKKRIDEYDVTWWMLTQHYLGFDTRLLDITRNALIALYFACEKHFDEDGFVYVFHSMDKTSEKLNASYLKYEDHIRDLGRYYRDDSFVYMRPTVALDRINRQEGEFLWIKDYHLLRRKGLYESNQIIPIVIRAEYKKRLLAELSDPQGIHAEFLALRS